MVALQSPSEGKRWNVFIGVNIIIDLIEGDLLKRLLLLVISASWVNILTHRLGQLLLE